MYRKIKADTIFDGYRFLPGNKVLICNAAGSVEAIVDDADAGDDIAIIEGMLSPGFINTHCHIELSHLKGKIPEHTGLVNFVQQVMSGRESSAPEQILAMQQAADELYESGTVAIGDICNTADSIALKRHSHLHWHNFIELSGFVDAGAVKRFEAACVLAEAFNELSSVTTLT
ncbi:MAG: amidohydrolase, partial [Pedobacter sp.]